MRKYTYFKRYRMELDLRRPPTAASGLDGSLCPAAPPTGCYWVPWAEPLRDAHAEVKALSFQDELDSAVFPSLATLAGCRDLMTAIRERPGFCPRATWLVATTDLAAHDCGGLARGCVATVQGVIDEEGYGAIQNVGVVPEFRGRGLGRALVLRALAGFAAAGARRAYLEVTARNGPAVRMYRALGFRCYRTVYRAVPLPEQVAVGI